MSLSNCTGPNAIASNPDISGVGVRTAIYAQAILTLIQPILATLDGRISEDEIAGLHRLYLGILLPGCALLISAIIQAKTFGISVYHATIVLNLSWINNTSALIFFQFAIIAQLELDKELSLRKEAGDRLKDVYALLKATLTEEGLKTRTFECVVDHTRKTLEVVRVGIERTKFEASRDLMQNVVDGLEILALHGDSILRNSGVSGGEVAEQKRRLQELIRNQKIRIPKSLGADIDEEEERRDEHNSRVLKVIDKAKTKFEKFNSRISNSTKTSPSRRILMRILQRDWTMSSLASAHLTLFATFGIWLWFTIHHFGINGECEPLTKYSIIVHTIPVNSPGFRIFSIIIYIISSIPFINIAVLGGLEYGFILIFHRIFASLFHRARSCTVPMTTKKVPKTSKSSTIRLLHSFIVLTALFQAYFIISTELTIKKNGFLLNQDDEAKWSFGQTLAVALTIVPLLDVIKEIWKNVKMYLKRSN